MEKTETKLKIDQLGKVRGRILEEFGGRIQFHHLAPTHHSHLVAVHDSVDAVSDR